MLEPRIATLGACSRISSHIASTSSTASGPKAPSERPWPRESRHSAATPLARARRPKSKWFSLAEPAPWSWTTPRVGSPSGRKSA